VILRSQTKRDENNNKDTSSKFVDRPHHPSIPFYTCYKLSLPQHIIPTNKWQLLKYTSWPPKTRSNQLVDGVRIQSAPIVLTLHQSCQTPNYQSECGGHKMTVMAAAEERT
jgi:hypothetical protein